MFCDLAVCWLNGYDSPLETKTAPKKALTATITIRIGPMSNHFEGLGKTWLTLLNDPEKEVFFLNYQMRIAE